MSKDVTKARLSIQPFNFLPQGGGVDSVPKNVLLSDILFLRGSASLCAYKYLDVVARSNGTTTRTNFKKFQKARLFINLPPATCLRSRGALTN